MSDSLETVTSEPTAIVTTEKPVTLKISEIYVCSQGEGPLTGVPSILLRASGCNLRCKFTNKTTGKANLCDTWWTSWSPESDKQLREMTLQDIYTETVKLATTFPDGKKRANPLTNIIFSGGEPTLGGKDFTELCQAFLLTGFHITVETNGTKYVEVQTTHRLRDKREIDLSQNILFSISPKLTSSVPWGTPHEKKHNKERINLIVLEALLKRYPSYLKFVISADEDLAEVKEIQKELKLVPSRIYLMPEGITREQVLQTAPKINDLCIENGYRFSNREHILLYDNKRGV